MVEKKLFSNVRLKTILSWVIKSVVEHVKKVRLHVSKKIASKLIYSIEF